MAYDYAENGQNLIYWDPRQLRFGKRILNGGEGFEEGLFDEYTDRRYQMGLAEGGSEIEFGKALPLEHNLGTKLIRLKHKDRKCNYKPQLTLLKLNSSRLSVIFVLFIPRIKKVPFPFW